MRQYDKIGAVLGERQPMGIGKHLRGLLEVDAAPGSDA